MALITLDFETYYSREYSLTRMTMEQYIRNPQFEVVLVGIKKDKDPPYWATGTKGEIKAHLHTLDIPNSYLLCHNAAFDGFVLSHHFGLAPKFYLDTLAMARPRHAMTTGVSLKALSDYYTVGIKGDEILRTLGKRRADFSEEELKAYGDYCTTDVQLTYMLLKILRKDFPMSELRVIDLLLRMYTQPHVLIDATKLKEHLRMIVENREKIVQTLDIEVKDSLMSNQKFAKVLTSLGVVPPMKTSKTTKKQTYAFSKTDPEFTALLHHPSEEVQTVVAARLGVKSTIEETRTAALIAVSERGPLPILLNYYGGHTGRASGGDRLNLQNLPRGGAIRKALCAPDGFRFVVGDSAQIEARVLAWLAGEDGLVESFAANEDIYSTFASSLYGFEVTKETHPLQRHVGKTCILGLGYGMGARKLTETLLVGKPKVLFANTEAEEAVKLYRSTYKRIPWLWERGHKALYQILAKSEFTFGRNALLKATPDGILLPNNMYIRYPHLTKHPQNYLVMFYASSPKQCAEYVKQNLDGKYNADLLTHIYGGKVIENVVQALARIIVFDQMLTISTRYRCSFTVHDEVVACVPEEEVDEARQFVSSVMGTPPRWAKSLPLSSEVHAHFIYREAKGK